MALVRLSAVNGTVRDIEINRSSRCDWHDLLPVSRTEESIGQKRIHYLDGADNAVRVRPWWSRSMDQVWDKSADPIVVNIDKHSIEQSLIPWPHPILRRQIPNFSLPNSSLREIIHWISGAIPFFNEDEYWTVAQEIKLYKSIDKQDWICLSIDFYIRFCAGRHRNLFVHCSTVNFGLKSWAGGKSGG